MAAAALNAFFVRGLEWVGGPEYGAGKLEKRIEFCDMPDASTLAAFESVVGAVVGAADSKVFVHLDEGLVGVAVLGLAGQPPARWYVKLNTEGFVVTAFRPDRVDYGEDRGHNFVGRVGSFKR